MLDFELNTMCSDWYYYSFRLTIESNSVDLLWNFVSYSLNKERLFATSRFISLGSHARYTDNSLALLLIGRPCLASSSLIYLTRCVAWVGPSRCYVLTGVTEKASEYTYVKKILGTPTACGAVCRRGHTLVNFFLSQYK